MKPMTKKQWQKVDGIVLLDKPEGVTSNGLLQQVRRVYNAKKAGHTGALDPFATGLLPICLGEATKVSGLLLDANKRYQATLKLGVATDTADKEGQPVLDAPIPVLDITNVTAVLQSLTGELEQVPPMYSALKYQGKPLYEYARQGIEIERPARRVTLFELTLLDLGTDEIRFEVFCSKGTYVRTLGEEIAVRLGTVGHLTQLRRIQTGALMADAMHPLSVVEQAPQDYLQPLDLPLAHLEAVSLDAKETDWVQHGGMLSKDRPKTDLVRFYNPDGQFIGVGEWHCEKHCLKPKRLFNL